MKNFFRLLVCAGCWIPFGLAQAQNYSLVVGVDGLGIYGVHAADTPNLDNLIDGTFSGAYNGAYAQHSFAGGILGTPTQQVTGSGPGWATILTSTWVDKHQVNGNQFGPPELTPNLIDNPSYLETLEESLGGGNIYTASSIHWTPIDTHIISTINDGNSSIDFRATGSDAASTATAASQIAGFGAGNSALFVHLDNVDGAGHGSGNSSPYNSGYLSAVATIDTQIGTMLTAIQARPDFDSENWQIIVTSDHGYNSSLNPDGNGNGENGHRGHGGQTDMERTVPIIIASKNAEQGFVPSSAGHVTSQADVAPTVLNHFGISTPANYDGQAIGGTKLFNNTSSLKGPGSGLVSHLEFDGDTNEGLAGSGGTISGNVQYVSSPFGQAVSVANYGDGSVKLDDDLGALFGASTDFSMSMWVKFDSHSGDPTFFGNKDASNVGNTGINLGVGTDEDLRFYSKAAGGISQDVDAPETFSLGDWQNVVFRVDRDGKTNLFLDGVLVGTRETTSLGSLDGAFNWVLLNDGTGNFANGTITGLAIDEFAAWDRLLTDDEISILSQTNLDTLALNGIVGDVNQDGVVSGDGTGPAESDDISKFREGWLASGLLGDYERFTHGDLNLDGITSIEDWRILNSALLAATGSTGSLHVPEPSSLVLAGLSLAGISLARRRKEQLNSLDYEKAHYLELPMRRVSNRLRFCIWVTVVCTVFTAWRGESTWACDNCGCNRTDGAVCTPHAHDGPAHGHGSSITSFNTSTGVAAGNAAEGSAAPLKFAVIGDTQGSEFGGHSNLLTRLMESVKTHDVDYILFPGDLIGDSGSSGWAAWDARTSGYGVGGTNLNQFGRDLRLMTPGNHDRGSGGTFGNWQNEFSWLPNNQTLGGQSGIDQVDYFVDEGNVRFVSISSDAPGSIYNGRVVNEAPPALDWMREVMKDVDTRNADTDPNNNIDHVFTFSHRAVTTQNESPTGGTNGAWWESMTGQDAASGNHAATAFLPGHWHMYQPSRPDPDVDTMEIISGTGGGGLEGQAHRNRHGYSIITVDGGDVTSQFYGDTNQGSDNWNFQLLDSYTVAKTGGLPTGVLALYEFESGANDTDSSISALSKGHTLNFNSGAGTFNDPQQGRVLDLSGSGYVDAKDIGDNNFAVLRDLTILLSARVDTLDGGAGDNTLVAFGGADGSANSDLLSQESANHAYKLSMTAAGNLQLAWQHDDAVWQTIASDAPVSDPTQWHDYEVRRDGDNMAIAFFVDGEQLGLAKGFGILPTGAGSGSLYIGSGVGGALGFDGWIDNVQISSAQVSVTPPLLGDINGDGMISGNGIGTFEDDDVVAFVSFWLQEDGTPADLNFDGITNIADWGILNSLDPSMGAAVLAALGGKQVPEPSSISILLLGLGALSMDAARATVVR